MATGVAAAMIVIPPLFTADETKPEVILKSLAIIDMFLLFINSFFGYWVSLDRDQFTKQISTSWSTFCAWTIIFYLVVQTVAFVGFVGVVFRWVRALFGLAALSFLLFAFGLTNVGLRANGFSFFLLFFGWILLLTLGYHYLSMEKCAQLNHPANCRGECFRLITVRWLNEQIFFGKLENLTSAFAARNNTTNAQSNTHVRFNNEVDELPANEQIPSREFPSPATSLPTNASTTINIPETKPPISKIEPTINDHENGSSFQNSNFSNNLLNDNDGKL